MRAFLAVEIEPEAHAQLVALKHELADSGATVRWVRDEALHVTVKFLGSVTGETRDELHAALSAPLAGLAPLDARLRGVGVFPDWRRPRIVWAGVDCDGLAALAATVDDAAARFGIAPESRPFSPHVTLGRVRDTRGWAPLEAALRARLTDVVGICRFSALNAVRSDLRPDGALYTTRWSIPFGA